MGLSDQLKVARTLLGESQDLVAAKTGLTQNTVWKSEHKAEQMNLSTIAILADYYDMEMRLCAKES